MVEDVVEEEVEVRLEELPVVLEPLLEMEVVEGGAV